MPDTTTDVALTLLFTVSIGDLPAIRRLIRDDLKRYGIVEVETITAERWFFDRATGTNHVPGYTAHTDRDPST